MGTLLQQSILNGITFAGLLFLVSSGFTLAYGLVRLLNLAHGAFYLWGGYLSVTLLSVTGSFWLALLLAGVVIGVVGLALERALFWRVQGDELREVLLTVALALVMADVALMAWGGHPINLAPPESLSASIPLLGARLPLFRGFVVSVAVLIMLGFWLMLKRTAIGAMLRACVDDKEMVDAVGINTRTVYRSVWFCGLFLAAIGGAFGAVLMGLYPGVDTEVLLLALVVVVIGGLGSFWGAALGSLIVGLSWSLASIFAPQLLYFVIFAPMVLVLMVRPQGLLGVAR